MKPIRNLDRLRRSLRGAFDIEAGPVSGDEPYLCEKKNVEIADDLIEMLGKDKSLKKFVTDRPGHDFRYSMDISKIENELGWRPAIQFEEGLKETVKWYMDNPAWLEEVTSGAYRDYYDKMYKIR